MPNTFSSLQNAIAVVTGGTQGVGEAIARTLAERGAAGLVICGRNAERGAAVAREITARAAIRNSCRPTSTASRRPGPSPPAPIRRSGGSTCS